MGGTVALSIVKPDGKIINNVTWTGADMTFFISKQYANNDIEGAIKLVNREMKRYRNNFLDEFTPGFEKKPYEWTKLMAPYSYGLVVIDFTKKIIRNMQHYNFPAHKELITYIRALEQGADEPFAQLTENNSLVVLDKDTNQRYSFEEFFGTTNPRVIRKIISHIQFGKFSSDFENIDKKNYKIFSYKDPLFKSNLNIIPSTLDFELVHYQNDQYSLLLSDLIKDGHTFSNKEKAQWIDFIKNRIEYDTKQENPTLNHEDIQTLTLEIATNEVENAFNNTATSKLKIK